MWSLTAESWMWYGLVWLAVGLRGVARWQMFKSLKKLQVEDYLMLFAVVTDTVLIVGMNIISHTSSNLIDPNDKTPLTPESIKEREFGSKMVLVVEQMQILTIWTVKFCLLIMFNRLTTSLKRNLLVKFVAGYVALGFVVMEILYLAVWCRPFEQYWAVPPDNVQCSAATNHLIVNTVLNISSDIMIISIPMPILLQSQLPPKRKAALCGVFCLGIFTILSAVLNKYYSFSEPFGAAWTFWYIRESSTAMIVANLPLIWPLIRRVFKIHSIRSTEGPSVPKSSAYYRNHNRGTGRQQSSGVVDSDGDFERGGLDSREHINADFKGGDLPLTIYQHTDVEVSRSPVNGGRASSENESSVDLGTKSMSFGSRAVIEGRGSLPTKGFQGV